MATNHQELCLALIRSRITSYPNFPQPGVDFKDVFSLMLDPEAFQALTEILKEKASSLNGKVDAVVALDARGFLFGPLLALELKIPFVPVRKAGKLPGECYEVEYSLEYGKSMLEIQKGVLKPGQRVVLVDDLLATGGTLSAAARLVESCQAVVQECFVIIELTLLRGRLQLDPHMTVTSVLQF